VGASQTNAWFPLGKNDQSITPEGDGYFQMHWALAGRLTREMFAATLSVQSARNFTGSFHSTTIFDKAIIPSLIIVLSSYFWWSRLTTTAVFAFSSVKITGK